MEQPEPLPGKLDWIKRYFGGGVENLFYEKVVFSHRKDINLGDKPRG